MRGGDYLLDTHAFLWLASDDRRLSRPVRTIALEAGNKLRLSVASIWELAIKASLGKIRLAIGLADLIAGQREALGLAVLPIATAHAIEVEHLPFHHRDPFDRLLVAQARVEELTLVSRDRRLDSYDIERVWD